MDKLLGLLLINLVGLILCSKLPRQDKENVANNEKNRPHHHHYHHRHHEEILNELETTEEEIRRLQLLDRLLGQVEEAAASDIDLDIDLPPEIEEELMMLEDMGDNPEDEPKDFRMIALPHKFSKYDLNGDSYVTRDELANATETSVEDCLGPLTRADIDGDGRLSEEELYNAPWVFNSHKHKLDRVME